MKTYSNIHGLHKSEFCLYCRDCAEPLCIKCLKSHGRKHDIGCLLNYLNPDDITLQIKQLSDDIPLIEKQANELHENMKSEWNYESKQMMTEKLQLCKEKANKLAHKFMKFFDDRNKIKYVKMRNLASQQMDLRLLLEEWIKKLTKRRDNFDKEFDNDIKAAYVEFEEFKGFDQANIENKINSIKNELSELVEDEIDINSCQKIIDEKSSLHDCEEFFNLLEYESMKQNFASDLGQIMKKSDNGKMLKALESMVGKFLVGIENLSEDIENDFRLKEKLYVSIKYKQEIQASIIFALNRIRAICGNDKKITSNKLIKQITKIIETIKSSKISSSINSTNYDERNRIGDAMEEIIAGKLQQLGFNYKILCTRSVNDIEPNSGDFAEARKKLNDLLFRIMKNDDLGKCIDTLIGEYKKIENYIDTTIKPLKQSFDSSFARYKLTKNPCTICNSIKGGKVELDCGHFVCLVCAKEKGQLAAESGNFICNLCKKSTAKTNNVILRCGCIKNLNEFDFKSNNNQ